ncbi:MAG: hypothetical protein HXX17_11880 [Geobacteraceae bacterium]|nr:hypothetical protein [Geobacteraceae bacterium]
MSKFASFFKNFFRNIAADPVSSVKGVLALAASGATVYGMTTGAVPVNAASIGAASTFAANGLHALGTGPVTDKAADVIQSAAALSTSALTVADHYEEIRKQAGNATAILSAVAEGAAVLKAEQPQVPSL